MTILLKTGFIMAFIAVASAFLPSSVFQSMGLPLDQLESFIRTLANNISSMTPWLDLVMHGDVVFNFIKGFLYFGFVYVNFKLFMLVFNLLK